MTVVVHFPFLAQKSVNAYRCVSGHISPPFLNIMKKNFSKKFLHLPQKCSLNVLSYSEAFNFFETLSNAQSYSIFFLDFIVSAYIGQNNLIRQPSKTPIKAPFKNRFFGVRYPYPQSGALTIYDCKYASCSEERVP